MATSAIVLALALHHSGAAMSDMHHSEDMGAVVEMCLDALGLVGAAAVAIVLGSG